jgi:hypothetical protein
MHKWFPLDNVAVQYCTYWTNAIYDRKRKYQYVQVR